MLVGTGNLIEMDSLLVSVILPTYNRAATLPRAIQSVLNQSYRDLELIVVDDASTDGTNQELEKFTDPRLRIIWQARNSGQSAARNAGIRAATGKYIAFQDSDCEWLPGKLAEQIRLMESADERGEYPAACYSRFVITRGKKRVVLPRGSASELSGRIYSRLLSGNTVDTPVTIVRADALKDVGFFDESLTNLEDWDLGLRLAMKYRIAFVDDVTLVAHSQPGSVNKAISPLPPIGIFQKYREAYEELPQAMACITWYIGSSYAINREIASALPYLKVSIGRSFKPTRFFLLAFLLCGVNLFPAIHSLRRTLYP